MNPTWPAFLKWPQGLPEPHFLWPQFLWLLLVLPLLVLLYLWMLRRKKKLAVRYASRKPLAWNGLVAYAASLYPWLLLRDPLLLLWIPLFHSLQYLAVVWRYQANVAHKRSASWRGRALRLGGFAGLGLALGWLGFWGLPTWLGRHVPYDQAVFGDSLFLFIFWIFINVHHYFLDTVMWRKGNPDVAEHLFGMKPAREA